MTVQRIQIGGCFEWRGARNRDGYGTTNQRVDGRWRSVLAHRLAYEESTGGPVPEGMCVLHVCDNPPCVNPQHLRLGTQADNVRDCQTKGRRNQSRKRSNLTAVDVEEIRRSVIVGKKGRLTNAEIQAGAKSQQQMAKRFGITQASVSSIVQGKTWQR